MGRVGWKGREPRTASMHCAEWWLGRTASLQDLINEVVDKINRDQFSYYEISGKLVGRPGRGMWKGLLDPERHEVGYGRSAYSLGLRRAMEFPLRLLRIMYR